MTRDFDQALTDCPCWSIKHWANTRNIRSLPIKISSQIKALIHASWSNLPFSTSSLRLCLLKDNTGAHKFRWYTSFRLIHVLWAESEQFENTCEQNQTSYVSCVWLRECISNKLEQFFYSFSWSLTIIICLIFKWSNSWTNLKLWTHKLFDEVHAVLCTISAVLTNSLNQCYN